MSKILIKNLQINACHGVHAEEKVEPQPFIFSGEVLFDIYNAGKSDKLEDTINYSAICRLIDREVQSNCFDLIEHLLTHCMHKIMEQFPQIQALTLRVEKPHAPIPLTFESVGVEQTFCREQVYLSLGSSQGDKQNYLQQAIEKIAKIKGVTLLKSSQFIKTAPYGGVAKNEFLNCAVLCECYLPPENLLMELQAIEQELHRVREVRWDDRTLDIDIIFFGKRQICTPQLTVPHVDYHNRDFVLIPLSQLNEEWVCPKFLQPIKKIMMQNKS